TISPAITITNLLSPPIITILSGDTLISSHGSTYQWYLNGSQITGATDSFYVVLQGGTYSVQITSSGCNSISAGVLITAINDLNSKAEPELYPNPVSQTLVIKHGSLGKEATLTIFNVLGAPVFSPLLQRRTGSELIDVSSLSNGVYFLKIETGEQTVNKKF